MTYDVFVELMRDASGAAYNQLLEFWKNAGELAKEYAARLIWET